MTSIGFKRDIYYDIRNNEIIIRHTTIQTTSNENRQFTLQIQSIYKIKLGTSREKCATHIMKEKTKKDFSSWLKHLEKVVDQRVVY